MHVRVSQLCAGGRSQDLASPPPAPSLRLNSSSRWARWPGGCPQAGNRAGACLARPGASPQPAGPASQPPAGALLMPLPGHLALYLCRRLTRELCGLSSRMESRTSGGGNKTSNNLAARGSCAPFPVSVCSVSPEGLCPLHRGLTPPPPLPVSRAQPLMPSLGRATALSR